MGALVAEGKRARGAIFGAVLAADALLAGWAIALRAPGLGYLPTLPQVAWSWGILAIGLLGAWGLSKLMRRTAGPGFAGNRDEGGSR